MDPLRSLAIFRIMKRSKISSGVNFPADPYDMDSDSEHRRISQEIENSDEESNLEVSNTNDEIEDSECTFGSPGLRRVFNSNNHDFNTNNHQSDVIDEDDDTKEESSMALNEQNSPISRSRNKRKNFKPRNIIYDT